MNRSRDVKGPELKRPQDDEAISMKDMHGDAMTGTLSKHPLDSLHQGHIESPLTALGQQEVKVSGASAGAGSREPKGMGRSVAKKMQYAEKKKSQY